MWFFLSLIYLCWSIWILALPVGTSWFVSIIVWWRFSPSPSYLMVSWACLVFFWDSLGILLRFTSCRPAPEWQQLRYVVSQARVTSGIGDARGFHAANIRESVRVSCRSMITGLVSLKLARSVVRDAGDAVSVLRPLTSSQRLDEYSVPSISRGRVCGIRVRDSRRRWRLFFGGRDGG